MQKKFFLAHINGIQIALYKNWSSFLIDLEKILLSDLDQIHSVERRIWAQKAEINRRKVGDYNTKYFHLVPKIEKSKAKFLLLRILMGIVLRIIRF